MATTYCPTITIKTDAFQKGVKQVVRCCCAADGSVLVWDDVAGHFTRRHNLNANLQGRVRARYVRLHREYWLNAKVSNNAEGGEGRVVKVRRNCTVDIKWANGTSSNEAFESVGWVLGTPGAGASDEY